MLVDSGESRPCRDTRATLGRSMKVLFGQEAYMIILVFLTIHFFKDFIFSLTERYHK